MFRTTGVSLSKSKELKYRISKLSQLPQCKSNNSRDLSIRVEELIQSDILTGTKVSVVHADFGTLFATVVNAKGNLVSNDFTDHIYTIPWDVIEQELAKYGFIVQYREETVLRKEQVEYLKTLQGFKFDKIRFITVERTVKSIITAETMIVAFNIEQNPQWLHNTYNPSYQEYVQALENGSVMNISNISETHDFSWDWLWGKVLSISDILEAQVDNE